MLCALIVRRSGLHKIICTVLLYTYTLYDVCNCDYIYILSRTKTFDSLDPSPKCHLPKLKHISAEALP